MNKKLYSSQYLLNTNNKWHSEDSLWKANQIFSLLIKNKIKPNKITEIGCGAGQILFQLSKKAYLKKCSFSGYEKSLSAIQLCPKNTKIKFFLKNPLTTNYSKVFKNHILLVIDVIEHVPNYLNFMKKCAKFSEYKLYHIPLDIHVSSVFRKSFTKSRYTVGHLHYFTFESAVFALKDTGHDIVDYVFTSGSFGVFWHHKSIKTALANLPRFIFSIFSEALSARLFGGYSALILAK